MGNEQAFELPVNMDEQGNVQIPLSLRKKYGLHPNDEVFLRGTERGVEVCPRAQPTRITDDLYLVGGLDTSHPWDGACYLIKGPAVCYLIDCGSELGFEHTVENIRALGVNPADIAKVFLTHCHYDHSSAAPLFRQRYGTRIAIHELGKGPIEAADERWTASFVYRKTFSPFSIDETLRDGQDIQLGEVQLRAIHIPGHCPENTAFYGLINDKNVCFVGDLGGGHSENWHSSIEDTANSIRKLQDLAIDFLCQGHLLLTDKARVHVQLKTWWEMTQDAWFDYMLYDRL